MPNAERQTPTLTLAAAQPNSTPYDVAANAWAHAQLVREAAARVVVFPELSLTGYHLDAPTLDPADTALSPLIAACAEADALALAGAPVAGEKGRVHIGILAISGQGARVVYRKTYLGGAEAKRFSPGEPAVLEVGGWRLGLAVCKDTGVPAHAAATAALGMDAYVAGVLETTEDAGVTEERALRITRDHGVWAVTAGFAGSTGEGYTHAAGGSGIWSPEGTVVARVGSQPGQFARAVLSLASTLK